MEYYIQYGDKLEFFAKVKEEGFKVGVPDPPEVDFYQAYVLEVFEKLCAFRDELAPISYETIRTYLLDHGMFDVDLVKFITAIDHKYRVMRMKQQKSEMERESRKRK